MLNDYFIRENVIQLFKSLSEDTFPILKELARIMLVIFTSTCVLCGSEQTVFMGFLNYEEEEVQPTFAYNGRAFGRSSANCLIKNTARSNILKTKIFTVFGQICCLWMFLIFFFKLSPARRELYNFVTDPQKENIAYSCTRLMPSVSSTQHSTHLL